MNRPVSGPAQAMENSATRTSRRSIWGNGRRAGAPSRSAARKPAVSAPIARAGSAARLDGPGSRRSGRLAAFAVGIVAMAAFIWWQTTTDHPMLDVRFFKNARFSAANLAITLAFFAMVG